MEPIECLHAKKTDMHVIDEKSYAVQEGVVRSYTDITKGSLDLDHNCRVSTHTQRGMVLDCQVTQMVLEVSVRQEWARVNEVSVMISTTFGLIVTCERQEHDEHFR